MNSNLYVENPNGAIKLARKEVYDEVQAYLCFYRQSKGFTKYFQREPDEIINMAEEKWQAIMNAVNANALYLGRTLYNEHLAYVNKLRELMQKPAKGVYSIVMEWKENYTELAALCEKLEHNEKEEENDKLFIEFFNELRIAANK